MSNKYKQPAIHYCDFSFAFIVLRTPAFSSSFLWSVCVHCFLWDETVCLGCTTSWKAWLLYSHICLAHKKGKLWCNVILQHIRYVIIAVCLFAFLSLNKIIGQNSRSGFHYTWLRCAAYMGNTQEAIKCWDGAAGSHSLKLPWHWPMAEEALSKCPLISAHATQRKVPNAISIRVSVWTKARFLLIRRNELVTSWKTLHQLKT